MDYMLKVFKNALLWYVLLSIDWAMSQCRAILRSVLGEGTFFGISGHLPYPEYVHVFLAMTHLGFVLPVISTA